MPFAAEPSIKAVTSFLGIRNTVPPRSIPDNALQAATNVDLDDAGTLLRRRGYQLASAFTDITASHKTFEGISYLIDNGTLYRIDSGLAPYSLGPSTATCFADKQDHLFTNDGLHIRGNTVQPLRIPVGSTGPQLTVTVGDWTAGQYSCVYCYYDSDTGLEGPASPLSTVTLTENQSIQVTPPPAVSGYEARIYMTYANDTIYRDSDDIPLDDIKLGATAFPQSVTELAVFENSLFASTPQSNGTSLITWSYPGYFHLFNPIKNYLVIPGEVRSMYGLDSGLIIVTDKAILVYDGAVVKELAPYGVSAGKSITPSPQGTVYINTVRGVCEALPFVNHTESKALFAPGQSCVTAIVDQRGMHQLVVLTDGDGSPYNSRY